MQVLPGAHIRKFFIVVGLGFLYCFFTIVPTAQALEVNDAMVIQEPRNLSQVLDHYPVVRVASVPIGETVTILLDNNPIVEFIPQESSFFYEPEKPFTSGIHYLTVKTEREVFSRTTLFEVLPYPRIPTISAPGEGETVSDATPSVEGLAEAKATVHIIVDDWHVENVATKNDNTNLDVPFAVELRHPLTEGAHTVEAKITDQYGTVSGIGNKVEFFVPLPPPIPAPLAVLGEKVMEEEEPTVILEAVGEEKEVVEGEEDEEDVKEEDERIFYAVLIVLFLLGAWWFWQRKTNGNTSSRDELQGQSSFWS